MRHPSSWRAIPRLLIGILAAAAACGLTACGSDSNPPMVPPTPCNTSPTNLSFGTVIVGENKDLTFTLRNTGTAQLAGTVTSPCGDFVIQGNATYDLAPGDSAAFTVRFAPSAPGSPTCT